MNYATTSRIAISCGNGSEALIPNLDSDNGPGKRALTLKPNYCHPP